MWKASEFQSDKTEPRRCLVLLKRKTAAPRGRRSIFAWQFTSAETEPIGFYVRIGVIVRVCARITIAPETRRLWRIGWFLAETARSRTAAGTRSAACEVKAAARSTGAAARARTAAGPTGAAAGARTAAGPTGAATGATATTGTTTGAGATA